MFLWLHPTYFESLMPLPPHPPPTNLHTYSPWTLMGVISRFFTHIQEENINYPSFHCYYSYWGKIGPQSNIITIFSIWTNNSPAVHSYIVMGSSDVTVNSSTSTTSIVLWLWDSCKDTKHKVSCCSKPVSVPLCYLAHATPWLRQASAPPEV